MVHAFELGVLEQAANDRDLDAARRQPGQLLGLEHEAIFYDEEALLRPVRNVRFLARQGTLNDVAPNALTHCNQTLFLVDGRATPLTPGTEIRHRVEDLYGRPWAAVWEEYFEEGMQRPKGEDIFDFEP